MALLKVLTVPNPKLKEKALPVEVVDDSVRKLMNDMVETMHHEQGIGLASIQVGDKRRVVVMDLSGKEPGNWPLKMANPEIIETSVERKANSEGCLSVPEQSAEVERYATVKVKYLDENNTPQELPLTDWSAVCIQHEIDHLNGILYIDYLSPLKREMLVKKSKKRALEKTREEKSTADPI